MVERHKDAELEHPENLTDQRLHEIVVECLRDWRAYPSIPGSLRRSRNGITAATQLLLRLQAAQQVVGPLGG